MGGDPVVGYTFPYQLFSGSFNIIKEPIPY